ncbi:MAG: hypothetical protein OXC72_12770 [Roseovarius sp.]|nr:hypothetical protein [Roseovarius sp.]
MICKESEEALRMRGTPYILGGPVEVLKRAEKDRILDHGRHLCPKGGPSLAKASAAFARSRRLVAEG